MSKPHFTLYSHDRGPNGWKVVFVLEELGLEYESIYLNFAKQEHKEPKYVNGFCPNGLVDHKANDFIIWESDAILHYLVSTYDTQGLLKPKTKEDEFKVIQWLFFQASGQGLFGQAAWFTYYDQSVPHALERYQNEIVRVLGVLELALKQNGTGWLVGKKRTIADISFITWNNVAKDSLMVGFKDFDMEKDFPVTYKWHTTMCEMPAIKKSLEFKASLQEHK